MILKVSASLFPNNFITNTNQFVFWEASSEQKVLSVFHERIMSASPGQSKS